MASGVYGVPAEDIVTNVVQGTEFVREVNICTTLWQDDHPRNKKGTQPIFPNDIDGKREALCKFFEDLIREF